VLSGCLLLATLPLQSWYSHRTAPYT
jgi:hypothetical protein